MFQINPNIFKINSDLQLLEDSLKNISLSEIPEIATQIAIVNDFIQGLLNDPNLPFHERDFLLSKQDQLVHLAGRCNNLRRSKQFEYVLEAKVDSVRASRLSAFKQNFNLTIAEKIQIKEESGSKIIRLSDQDLSVPDFSEVTEKCYKLAVLTYRANKGAFYTLFYSLPKEVREEIELHIHQCGGSLNEDKDSIHVIRALIGYGEQWSRKIINYPSPEEARIVIEDLMSLEE